MEWLVAHVAAIVVYTLVMIFGFDIASYFMWPVVHFSDFVATYVAPRSPGFVDVVGPAPSAQSYVDMVCGYLTFFALQLVVNVAVFVAMVVEVVGWPIVLAHALIATSMATLKDTTEDALMRRLDWQFIAVTTVIAVIAAGLWVWRRREAEAEKVE